MTSAPASPMTFAAGGPLKGIPSIPGDKSISHRAIMFSALALGESRVTGLSEGEDVASTAAAMEAMGAKVQRLPDGTRLVRGVGVGGLLQPSGPLDMGNSGTSARLIAGIVASHPITTTFTGDASLSRRPMNRVIEPLRRVGARIESSEGGRLPMIVRGASPALALTHRLAIASAQVKSAILLAGLNAPGETIVEEPVPSRDHSERMLALFGADIQVDKRPDGSRTITLRGEADLRAAEVSVPADPSAAAFLAVAALIVPGSEIEIRNVGVNPLRAGLYDVLRAMGADIAFANLRTVSGEPVADLIVRHSKLKATRVPADIVPAMIDEFPIFFVAAAFAEGESSAEGLAELRVKESDRIAVMAEGLRAIGVPVTDAPASIRITGSGGATLPGGATIDPRLDHRIAMSFAVAGLGCSAGVTVADMSPALTSFPGFAETLAELRA